MFSSSVWHDAAVWRISWLSLALFTLTVGGYMTWRMLVPAEPQLARRATTAFLAALVVSFVYAGSLLQRDAMMYESVHMASHLVVMLVLAPLAVMATSTSATTTPAQHVLARATRNPVLCFLAMALVVPLFHLTVVGSKAMVNNNLHAVELLFFAGIGVAYWRLVVSAVPSVRLPTSAQRVAYVALALPVIFFSGVAMTAMPKPLALMSAMPAPLALRDVHQAGVVMIVIGDGVLALYAFVILLAGRRGSRRPRTGSFGPVPSAVDPI